MRAGIVLLYAHWEGFVKFTAEAYIEHINERMNRFGTRPSEHFSDLLLWRCIRNCSRGWHKLTLGPAA